nr:hypothetical protein Iba_chr08eCG1580 [Ipomoea batatas]
MFTGFDPSKENQIFPTIFSLIAAIGKGGNVDDDEEDEEPDENGSGSEEECDEVGDVDISSGEEMIRWKQASKTVVCSAKQDFALAVAQQSSLLWYCNCNRRAVREIKRAVASGPHLSKPFPEHPLRARTSSACLAAESPRIALFSEKITWSASTTPKRYLELQFFDF